MRHDFMTNAQSANQRQSRTIYQPFLLPIKCSLSTQELQLLNIQMLITSYAAMATERV